MFLQVIQGKANDVDGLRRQVDIWERDLRSGASGYLGTTGGVAEDGTAIFLVRFDSEEAARANSDRPEQGEWWSETVKYFDGDPTFRNCREVDETLGGPAENAGFVQVMQGRVRDKARLRALEEEFMPQLTEMRPDVIGSIRGWDGDLFTDAIHFTSEADAREGESKMAENAGDDFAEFTSLVEDLTYIDLKDPWVRSA
jgi:peptidoglycan hydrolase-like protein with peptidoglycan-binding domain